MSERHVDFALVGGGLAAGNCARWLREEGAEGSILLIGREPDLPYNRPDCSKGYLRGGMPREETLFRPAGWYAEQDVEALSKVSVMALDVDERRLKLSNKDEVIFDKALLATGANVRRMNVPGVELEGIHYLRTLGNSDAIREDAAGKRVVLIGGSYIGSEVAASLTELGSLMRASASAGGRRPEPGIRRTGGEVLRGSAPPSTGSGSMAGTRWLGSRALMGGYRR